MGASPRLRPPSVVQFGAVSFRQSKKLAADFVFDSAWRNGAIDFLLFDVFFDVHSPAVLYTLEKL